MTTQGRPATVVIAGGRRIDARGAKITRFPLEAVPAVRSQVGKFLDGLQTGNPAMVVSSAAAGADLITLDEALLRGIRYRVVLPADPPKFRAASVEDRPGNWAPVFDRIIDHVAGSGDLVTLEDLSTHDDPYARATERVVAEAVEAAAGERDLLALLIWDGVERGRHDYSALLRRLAAAEGAKVSEISTRPVAN